MINSFKGIIGSRLNSLSVKEQICIQIASIIGRIFSKRYLIRLASEQFKLSEADVMLCVQQLLKYGLIKVYDTQEESYIFKHQTTMELAYSLMLYIYRYGRFANLS
jgi:predicted ATPase